MIKLVFAYKTASTRHNYTRLPIKERKSVCPFNFSSLDKSNWSKIGSRCLACYCSQITNGRETLVSHSDLTCSQNPACRTTRMLVHHYTNCAGKIGVIVHLGKKSRRTRGMLTSDKQTQRKFPVMNAFNTGTSKTVARKHAVSAYPCKCRLQLPLALPSFSTALARLSMAELKGEECAPDNHAKLLHRNMMA